MALKPKQPIIKQLLRDFTRKPLTGRVSKLIGGKRRGEGMDTPPKAL